MKLLTPAIPILAVGLLSSTTAVNAQQGNPNAGQRVFGACAACHSLESNRNMTGPSLAEIWNRKSGSLPSFPRYSPALKSAGIIWTLDQLWRKQNIVAKLICDRSWSFIEPSSQRSVRFSPSDFAWQLLNLNIERRKKQFHVMAWYRHFPPPRARLSWRPQSDQKGPQWPA